MTQKLRNASQLALAVLQSPYFFCKTAQAVEQCNAAIVAINETLDEQIIETVDLYGVKNGINTYLGQVPMPAKMKAKEITEGMFGRFEPNDGSDADLCYGSMCQLLDWMQEQAVLLQRK